MAMVTSLEFNHVLCIQDIIQKVLGISMHDLAWHDTSWTVGATKACNTTTYMPTAAGLAIYTSNQHWKNHKHAKAKMLNPNTMT